MHEMLGISIDQLRWFVGGALAGLALWCLFDIRRLLKGIHEMKRKEWLKERGLEE